MIGTLLIALFVLLSNSIAVLAQERPVDRAVPDQRAFPAIDYPSLRIELIRHCEQYHVVIDGSGTVTFAMMIDWANSDPFLASYTSKNRVVGGRHRRTLDRRQLDAVIDRFRTAGFADFRPSYIEAIDTCVDELRFRTGSREMAVSWDAAAEGPEALEDLADAVDRAADRASWIEGTERTVPALIAEGADLRGFDGANLAAAAMLVGNERVVIDAIRAGAPLDKPFQRGVSGALPLGLWLSREARQRGLQGVTEALAERGWPR